MYKLTNKTDALGRPIRLGGFYAYVRQDKYSHSNRIVTAEHETKTGVTVRVLLEARVTYELDKRAGSFREVQDTSVNIMSCKLFPVSAEVVKNLQGV